MATTGTSLAVLKELLECPVCGDTVLPHIYQCENGHLLCNDCRLKVLQCPLCKVRLTPVRNLLAETAVQQVPMRCKYHHQGCPKMIPYKEIAAHENNCDFSPIRCPCLKCNQKYPAEKVMDHFNKLHEYTSCKNAKYASYFVVKEGYLKKETWWNPTGLICEGKFFFLQCIRTGEGSWYSWIWFLGSKIESEDYLAAIIFYHKNFTLKYKGKVHSLRIAYKDIFKSGSCLVFSDTHAKTLQAQFEKNMGISYKVIIRKT